MDWLLRQHHTWHHIAGVLYTVLGTEAHHILDSLSLVHSVLHEFDCHHERNNTVSMQLDYSFYRERKEQKKKLTH